MGTGVDGCLYRPFYKHPKCLARWRQSRFGPFFGWPQQSEKPSTRCGAGIAKKTAKLLLREKKGLSTQPSFAALSLELHIHPWHATHAAHAAGAGASTLFLFHQLGHHRFGREQQPGD